MKKVLGDTFQSTMPIRRWVTFFENYRYYYRGTVESG